MNDALLVLVVCMHRNYGKLRECGGVFYPYIQ